MNPGPDNIEGYLQKIRDLEKERDYYAKELARRVADQYDPGPIDEDELERIVKEGSGVSLEAYIHEIVKDGRS